MKKPEIGIWTSTRDTLEDYRVLKDMGADTAFIDENYCAPMSEGQKRLLGYAREVGLKAHIFNYNRLEDSQIVLSKEGEFDDCPAFDGFVVYDEPSADRFHCLAALVPVFEKKYPGKTFFVNLLPMYEGLVPGLNLGADSYEEYVRRFCREVLSEVTGRRILSVDYYPLSVDREKGNVTFLEDTWLRNLEIAAREAKACGAEIHFYIQATEFGLYRREPKEEDFRLQLYLSMAFGVSMFSFFTYYSPLGGEFSEHQLALVDRDFRPTPRYGYAKKTVEEARAFGDELFSLRHEGVKTFAGKDNEDSLTAFGRLTDCLERLRVVRAAESEQNLVIGEFSGEGRTAHVIVNYTDPSHGKSNAVRLALNRRRRAAVYRMGARTAFEGEELSLTLAPGEGICVFWEE